MIQVAPYALNHPSYIENKVHRTMLSWIPPKVIMLHLRTKVYYEKVSIRKLLVQLSLSNVRMLLLRSGNA